MKSIISKIIIFCMGFLCLLPSIPTLHWNALPSWVGLCAGMVIALILGNPFINNTRKMTSQLLVWSVAGLGTAMNLKAVAIIGLQGFGYTSIGIAGTLFLGIVLGKILGIRKNASILVSVGTAVCGGSAIAAISSAINADEEETSLSLATIFVFNAAALLVFPLVGHSLHLSERAFGLWAALAIHDTSSVVGATLEYGKEALAVATTTKLARALWIIPLTFAFGLWYSKKSSGAVSGKTKKPWFILWFLIAAALVTFIPVLQPAGLIVAEISKRGMVLTLFLLGLGLNRTSLAKVGPLPILQGLILWIIVGVLTLTAIMFGIIH